MGKLIVTEFMTLDGVAQAPGGPDEDRESSFEHGGWQWPVSDPESGEVMYQEASSMKALLLAPSGEPLAQAQSAVAHGLPVWTLVRGLWNL